MTSSGRSVGLRCLGDPGVCDLNAFPRDPAHLDCNLIEHHDALMRTTVTLDRDVERMLQQAMHRSRNGFKETLNAAIRAGLSQKPPRQ